MSDKFEDRVVSARTLLKLLARPSLYVDLSGSAEAVDDVLVDLLAHIELLENRLDEFRVNALARAELVVDLEQRVREAEMWRDRWRDLVKGALLLGEFQQLREALEESER